MLSTRLGIWIQNGMKQFSRKSSSFCNCSQTYWESSHTKPFPYFFMKEYKSGMEGGKERRERHKEATRWKNKSLFDLKL